MFNSPSFKELVISSILFPFPFTFFKVSTAHRKNLAQNEVYLEIVSSVVLFPFNPFLVFSGNCSGER